MVGEETSFEVFDEKLVEMERNFKLALRAFYLIAKNVPSNSEGLLYFKNRALLRKYNSYIDNFATIWATFRENCSILKKLVSYLIKNLNSPLSKSDKLVLKEMYVLHDEVVLFGHSLLPFFKQIRKYSFVVVSSLNATLKSHELQKKFDQLISIKKSFDSFKQFYMNYFILNKPFKSLLL